MLVYDMDLIAAAGYRDVPMRRQNTLLLCLLYTCNLDYTSLAEGMFHRVIVASLDIFVYVQSYHPVSNRSFHGC
jgi:hypothetical protein